MYGQYTGHLIVVSGVDVVKDTVSGQLYLSVIDNDDTMCTIYYVAIFSLSESYSNEIDMSLIIQRRCDVLMQ